MKRWSGCWFFYVEFTQIAAARVAHRGSLWFGFVVPKDTDLSRPDRRDLAIDFAGFMKAVFLNLWLAKLLSSAETTRT